MCEMELVLDILVAITAVIGAVLGIFNFVHQRNQEKVDLKITPKSAHFLGLDEHRGEAYLTKSEEFLNDEMWPDRLALEIVNLSKFPVVLGEVGFYRRGKSTRAAIPKPIVDEGKEWPYRLGSRESTTVYCTIDELKKLSDPECIASVFVRTECGIIAEGTSVAFREMVSELAKNI